MESPTALAALARRAPVMVMAARNPGYIEHVLIELIKYRILATHDDVTSRRMEGNTGALAGRQADRLHAPPRPPVRPGDYVDDGWYPVGQHLLRD